MQALQRAQLCVKLSKTVLRSSSLVGRSRIGNPFRALTTEVAPVQTTPSQATWDVRVLYDGECPLCLKEIDMLKERDANRNKISFVNIATSEYDPDQNGGITYGEAMGRIHGLLPDGSVIEGVEVFRRCYQAVGLGWVYAVTQFGPVERFANMVYNVWAKNRLALTGRSGEGIEEMRIWGKPGATCAETDDACELPL